MRTNTGNRSSEAAAVIVVPPSITAPDETSSHSTPDGSWIRRPFDADGRPRRRVRLRPQPAQPRHRPPGTRRLGPPGTVTHRRLRTTGRAHRGGPAPGQAGVPPPPRARSVAGVRPTHPRPAGGPAGHRQSTRHRYRRPAQARHDGLAGRVTDISVVARYPGGRLAPALRAAPSMSPPPRDAGVHHAGSSRAPCAAASPRR